MKKLILVPVFSLLAFPLLALFAVSGSFKSGGLSGLSSTVANISYVNVTGDTMTGQIALRNQASWMSMQTTAGSELANFYAAGAVLPRWSAATGRGLSLDSGITSQNATGILLGNGYNWTSSDGIQVGVSIAETITQTGTAGYTGFLVNISTITTGSGQHRLLDVQRGGGSKFMVEESGNIGIGTTSPSDKLDISSGTIRMAGSGAPTTGGALCLNTAGQMAKCTSAVDASGNCTCP